MITKLLARLNEDDIDRLFLLVKIIAQKDRTTDIPALIFENREDVFRYIERVEEDLETKFVMPPDNYLKVTRGFIDRDGLVMTLFIPTWDEVSQSEYSIVVDIYLSRIPHLIKVCDFRVL